MTEPWGRLRLEVVDDEIIVTLPFTSYTVTYYKPANSTSVSADQRSRLPLHCDSNPRRDRDTTLPCWATCLLTADNRLLIPIFPLLVASR